MTRNAHDGFAKDYLEEVLKPVGRFQAPLEVRDEARQIDAWFVPALYPEIEASRLGLLGAIVEKECLLEPVRAQLSPPEILKCIRRQLIFYGLRERDAARENRSVTEEDLVALWILCPNVSAEVRERFGAKEKEGWPAGVYFVAEGFKVAIVAINQLPKTRETLWLRTLGKGSVQKRAFEELKELPPDDPLRRNVLEVVGMWYSALQGKEQRSTEEEELIVELSAAYLELREAILQEGVERGIERGIERGRVQTQRQFIENFLIARFGELDENLIAAIEPLLELSLQELTRLMLELSNLDREEFLARLGNQI